MHIASRDDRLGLLRITVCMISGLLLFAACGAIVRGARTESLEEKLATVTDYVPKATTPVDQLIEVARKFKIPMAIEWMEGAGTPARYKTPASEERSVRALIQEIASASPEHSVEVADGLVRVYSPAAALHPFNFLNIRLKSYVAKEADLFDAEDQLRWAIRFTLEPEKYLNGYGGGYGRGANHIFQIPKFTLSVSDVSIRDVLNRITLAQGNALWVATTKTADLSSDEPHWRRDGVDGRHLPVTSAWRFLPLAEIGELAPEHVVVDVMIAGMADQRMTTIPVMLEDGLAEHSGAATGGATSEGSSYQFGAGIEKMGKDFVTLSVHLNAGWRGEADFNFEEKLQVFKDVVTEVRPDPRIRIRAYFERAEKP
jgi:hypothetical protein